MLICEDCKKVNKYTTYEHQFFRCLTCKKNICPLCKSKHNKNHDIIDYEQKYYICPNHNEIFSSYCKKCKVNLCIECESNHKDKENIILYRDLLPKKDLIKSQLNELRIKIDKYKEAIDKFKQDLDNIILNFEIYYSINDNIIKNYDKKKRNYQMLTNIKELENNNIKILNYLNNLDFKKDLNRLKKEPETKKRKKEKDINWFKKFIYLFILNEHVRKVDELAEYMKEIIKEDNPGENINEAELIFFYTKNSAKTDRLVIRAINDIEEKERNKKDSLFLPYISEYKELILDEFNEKCKNIINLIETKYLPNEKENESKGKCLKTLADYYRYLIEFTEASKKKQLIENCKKYYLEAETILNGFSCLNENKIGLLLNYSVFCYEILEDHKEAIKIAKSAVLKFEEKQKKFNINSNDEKYKDSFKIYESMKDNLKTWEEDN